MASNPHFGSNHDGDHPDRDDEWARLRAVHLKPKSERPASSARGVHHQALLSSDVERTIEFYQGLLEFPLTELFENRDYEGSTHFFFDIGNGNALAFFDFPGLGLAEYSEVLGGHHHLAISVAPDNWTATQEQTRRGRASQHIRSGTRRSTSPAPTANASNSSATHSARCTDHPSSNPHHCRDGARHQRDRFVAMGPGTNATDLSR